MIFSIYGRTVPEAPKYPADSILDTPPHTFLWVKTVPVTGDVGQLTFFQSQ
jgi:hypothetical protein